VTARLTDRSRRGDLRPATNLIMSVVPSGSTDPRVCRGRGIQLTADRSPDVCSRSAAKSDHTGLAQCRTKSPRAGARPPLAKGAILVSPFAKGGLRGISLPVTKCATILCSDLANERDGPAWGPEAETRIASLLSPEKIKGSRIRSAECFSTLCRVEVDHDNAEAQDRLGNNLPMEPPFDGETMIQADRGLKPPATINSPSGADLLTPRIMGD
jgi:hypothetical protein